MEKYLVVNLGLKSIRIIVFNEEGKQIFMKAKPVYSNLQDDRVEHNAKEWENNLIGLLNDLKQSGLSEDIKYITSTTSSSCIYGIDKTGEPTTPVMMVSDKRSKKQVDKINSLNSFKVKSKQYSYRCSTSSTIPKIIWFKDIEPSIYKKTHKWLGAGEFIHYFFTKEFVTDPLNAGKAFYDGEKYDAEILSDLEINSNLLPEVVEIGSQLDVTKSICSQYKLAEDCKLIVTTYDAVCAVIGSYDGSNNTACDVSGTVTSVRVLTDETIQPNTDSLVLSQELGFENKRIIGGSNNMGGGIMEWYKQAFFNENDKNVYYTMENQALRSSLGANGILFLPYLLGERAPFKAPNAKATFFGVSRSTKVQDFSRAVFEATAFVTNDLLNLSLNEGLEINALSVSGGLARFDLVNQIKADVTNKQVKVLENFESTSVGAFILLALSLKKYSSLLEASKSAVSVRKIIYPTEKNHHFYRSYFKFFKELNNSLLDKYNEHSKLLKQIENYGSNTLSNL